MADTKISGLPASTTPLAGTEVLPIVQSGSTVKVAVSDLTAGRAVATGALTVTGAATVSTTLGVTGVSTLTAGAVIQGLTVGRGGSAVNGNSAFGSSALSANTTGSNNTSLGFQAMTASLTGDNNTVAGFQAASVGTAFAHVAAFGNSALKANTASDNTAVGSGAAILNTSGTQNTIVGRAAFAANLTGGNNTAVGHQALSTSTSGNNTAVGFQAGLGLLAGAGNQFFGYNSGSAVTSGAKNVILGSYTGSAAPISLTGSNNIVLSDGDGVVRQVIDSSGNVGIGTTSPQAKLQVLDLLKISNAAQSQGALALGDGSSTNFAVGLARWNGATNAAGAGGMGYFAQGPSNSGGHYFYTGDAVAGSTTLRATIDTAGNVLVVSTGGLGYGTGSGGAVTQATSRTTGVTLDKTNGAITLVSAAGLATFQSFTVTNSKVAATDVVHVTQKSGTDLYQIFVTATAAGSFRISYATTGGTTTEQPVFNFAVIKAVTA